MVVALVAPKPAQKGEVCVLCNAGDCGGEGRRVCECQSIRPSDWFSVRTYRVSVRRV